MCGIGVPENKNAPISRGKCADGGRRSLTEFPVGANVTIITITDYNVVLSCHLNFATGSTICHQNSR